MHDQDMMKSLVNFTLLQLRFLSDLCTCGNRVNELSLIPESMVKLPSQYIARIASSFQSSISPKQVSNPPKPSSYINVAMILLTNNSLSSAIKNQPPILM